MSDYIGNSPNFATTPVQTGTGDGTANPITLNFVPGSSDAILVSFNGIVQTPGLHYNVLANQLTPTGPIPTGYPILITYKAIAAQLGVTQASAVINTPQGTITKTNVQDALNEVAAASGAKGTGTDRVFFENDSVVSQSYTIGSNSFISGLAISVATPAIFGLADHGFVAGSKLVLKTTGVLPTGLALDTVYYVISTGLTSSAFQASSTLNGSAINTTVAGSGTHSISKVKNALSSGPILITDNAIVTIPNGTVWTITG